MFDISIMNIVYTVINIFLMLFILKHFLFNPVDEIVKKRKAEIDKDYEDADTALENAKAKESEYVKKLEDAEHEREVILSDARKKGLDEYEEIINKANAEADEIVESARGLAEKEAKKALKQSDAKLVDMVIDAASKIAAVKHNEEDDRALYDQFIAKYYDNADTNSAEE